MKVIWKDIKGFEGLYQISNTGEVKSLGNKPRYPNRKDKILKAGKNSNHYYVVVLYKDGKKYTRKVHRLVVEAFIPNPYNKPCIDHIVPVTKDCCNFKTKTSNGFVWRYGEYNKGGDFAR